jgi:hypothetical protein
VAHTATATPIEQESHEDKYLTTEVIKSSRVTRQQSLHWRTRQSVAPPIESEPSINVTIGRVEVRAVSSDNSKSPTPKRSESPVMPLEEYLRKQRRGGER